MILENLVEEYRKITPLGNKHYEKARSVLPGGVSGSGKFIKPYPLYAKSAAGCRFEDLDGNTYVDMLMGNGVNILGHANETVRNAVVQAIDNPSFTFLAHERELLLASKICHHVDSLEMVRFANSGSEAVQMCTRAAMSYSNREKVAKFEGHFNGSWDVLLVSGARIDGNPSSPRPIQDGSGMPKSNLENVIVLPFNDTENAVSLIEKNAKELAAVILEPVTAFMLGCVPSDVNFLSNIREITRKFNITLIFDEIVTGFRLDLGGAAKYFGVSPDMHTMGKAISGGFPLSCYGGRKEIMEKVVTPTKEPSDLDNKIFQSGTFTGHPVSSAASLAVLKELEKGEVIPYINQMGDYMRSNVKKIAKEAGCRTQVTGTGSMFQIYFTDHPINNKRDALMADSKKAIEFSMRLLLGGVYFPPSHPALLSRAHTIEDLDFVLSVMEKAFFEIK